MTSPESSFSVVCSVIIAFIVRSMFGFSPRPLITLFLFFQDTGWSFRTISWFIQICRYQIEWGFIITNRRAGDTSSSASQSPNLQQHCAAIMVTLPGMISKRIVASYLFDWISIVWVDISWTLSLQMKEPRKGMKWNTAMSSLGGYITANSTSG